MNVKKLGSLVSFFKLKAGAFISILFFLFMAIVAQW